MPIPTVPRFEDPAFTRDVRPVTTSPVWGAAPKLNFGSTDGNILVFNNQGQMVMSNTLESLEQLIEKALYTNRTLTPGYTRDFGSDFWVLIGRQLSDLAIESMAERFVREALANIDRINAIDQFLTTLVGDTLYIHFRVVTDGGYKTFDFERTIR
jgi:hypothetical protein